jgi:hypothetical protein
MPQTFFTPFVWRLADQPFEHCRKMSLSLETNTEGSFDQCDIRGEH